MEVPDGVDLCCVRVGEHSSRPDPRRRSCMALVLAEFRRLTTLAFAMASPSVLSGELRGGGRGPVHGFPFFRRAVIQVSTICLEMEPSFSCMRTLGVDVDGVSNSSSAWRI
jgi:hypothetical protein